MSIYRGVGGSVGITNQGLANELNTLVQEAIDASEAALAAVAALETQSQALYVQKSGDTLTGELRGVDSTSSQGFMPQLQILNTIDTRIQSSPLYNPEFFQDFELITTAAAETRDYGLITDSVTQTIDYGAV